MDFRQIYGTFFFFANSNFYEGQAGCPSVTKLFL